ncbi:MAG: LytTR family DNA-binding domain-containing protein [Bacteroidota bacterium]
MSIDCIIVDDDRFSIEVLRKLVEQTPDLTVRESFEDPVAAVAFLGRNKVDLIFLDVEMPGMTGLELLNSLQEPPLVILVSSKKEYALEAFEFDVVDYLLKPPTLSRFLKAVGKATDRLKEEEPTGVEFRGNFIFVKSDSALVKVDIRDILWVEALADYVAILTPAKKYVAHSTMKSIEAKLPSKQFLRVHRSYIVRIDKIDAIEDNMVVIQKKLIPVGGTFRERLMNSLDFL